MCDTTSASTGTAPTDTGRNDVRITGFGGQGIILMGKILGTAATMRQHRHATLIQTYGPETRGSACRVDLILDDQPVDYPHLAQPDVLVVLSQDGYAKYRHTLAPRGLLLFDEDLVRLDERDAALLADGTAGGDTLAPVPARKLAEEAGGPVMTNMAMLGFMAAATGLIGLDDLEPVVAGAVPASTAAANRKALRRGYECGLARRTSPGSPSGVSLS